jgi:uncharacterized protein YaaN involved in tellurite resistance
MIAKDQKEGTVREEAIIPEILEDDVQLPEGELKELTELVCGNVDKILEDPKVMAELYSVSNVGLNDMNILNQKIKDIIGNDRGENITHAVADMRKAIGQLEGGVVQKTLWGMPIPFINSGGKKRLIAMAVRYEKAQEVVRGIVDTLQGGLAEIQQDNIELGRLGQHIRNSQEENLRNITVLETALEKIDAMEIPDDEQKAIDLAHLKENMLLKLQDAEVARHANKQFLITISYTMHTNKMLCESVSRTAGTTFTTAASGLALRSALARQKKLMEANAAAKTFTNELVKGNAIAFEKQSGEISKNRAESSVNPETLEKSYIILQKSIDKLSEAAQQTSEQAIENLKRLRNLKTRAQIISVRKPGTKEIEHIESAEGNAPQLPENNNVV